MEWEKVAVVTEGLAPAGPNRLVSATARLMGCGTGAFGQLWLQLEDGTYLQPWENASAEARLLEGAQYHVKYHAIVKDNRYSSPAGCDEKLPKAEPVKLLQLFPIR